MEAEDEEALRGGNGGESMGNLKAFWETRGKGKMVVGEQALEAGECKNLSERTIEKGVRRKNIDGSEVEILSADREVLSLLFVPKGAKTCNRIAVPLSINI